MVFVFLHHALVASVLQIHSSATFVPLPLYNFLSDTKQKGVRHYSHIEHHLLPNYSVLEMSWDVHVDPDSILALDSAHKEGVRLVHCSSRELVLHIPASYAEMAKAWKHVTASEEIHQCGHLVDHPLYHRVETLEFTNHPSTPLGFRTVVLGTEELYTAAQVLPKLEFKYHATPIVSLPESQQEAARRSYEARAQEVKGRRLAQTTRVGGGLVSQPTSPMRVYNSFSPVGHTGNSKPWSPLSHAQFGWNWDYKSRTMRNPQFRFLLPGMRGYVLLKNPYLKFLGSFHMNFSSRWDNVNPFQNPPVVDMKVKLEGNAQLNADLSLMMNVYKDVDNDVFGQHLFHIPLLDHWSKETTYFKRVRFYIADIPISLKPGMRCGLTAYHYGLFQGAVRAGLNVDLHVSATATFNSVTGADVHFSAKALQVKFLPPNWMIFTKHLEIGALLKTAFWLQGAIGPVKDFTVDFDLNPYVNASIMQEGEEAYGPQDEILQKELVVYPFRVINLPSEQEWSVGIQVNQVSKMTSTALSLNRVVEFHDFVDHFRFGPINQKRLMKEPIYVVLFSKGRQQVGQTVAVYCESIVAGECAPSPAKAFFELNGQPVIVQMTIAWHADPVGYLQQQTRAISVVFPQFALSQQATDDYNRNVPSSVFARFTRNGRKYEVPATASRIRADLVVVQTHALQNLGMQWIHAWRVKYGSIVGQAQVTQLIEPEVELVYIRNGKEEVAARTFLPRVDWDAELNGYANPRDIWKNGAYAGNIELNLQMWKGTDPSGNPLNSAANFFNRYPASQGQMYVTGTMGLAVHNARDASRFIVPAWHDRWGSSETRHLVWTTRDGRVGEKMNFVLTILKLDPNTGTFLPSSVKENLNNRVCSETMVAAQRNFPDYGDVCHFQEPIDISDDLHSYTVVFQLDWQGKGGLANQMRSPAVTFSRSASMPPGVGAPQQRRLEVSHEDNGNVVVHPPSNKDGIDIQFQAVPLNETVGVDGTQNSRRLQASPYGYSKSNIDFKKKMSALHPICVKKNLNYSLGAGMYFRAKLDSMHVPAHPHAGALNAPLAMLSNFASALDTGDISLLNKIVGRAFSKVLPKGLCNAGVCQGSLPGCPGKIVHSTVIPSIEFRFNRQFLWTPNATQSVRNSVAYAMALFPEAVRIISLVLGGIFETTTTTMNWQETIYEQGDVLWSTSADGQKHACRWEQPPSLACQAQFYYNGMRYEGCTMIDNDRLGWCSVDRIFQGNWRKCLLNCDGRIISNPQQFIQNRAIGVGPTVMPGGRRLEERDQESDRFIVHIDKEALHYLIDEDLIQNLARRQAFRGMDDGRGEAKIISFRVNTGDTKLGEGPMTSVGPEQKFEFDVNDKVIADVPLRFGMKSSAGISGTSGTKQRSIGTEEGVNNVPTVLGAAGLAVLVTTSLVVGWRVFKGRSVVSYSSVEDEEQMMVD